MKEFKNLVSAEQKIFTDLSKTDHLKVENDQLKRILLLTIGVVVAIAFVYCIDRYLEEKSEGERQNPH